MDYYLVSILYLIALAMTCMFTSFVCVLYFLTRRYARELKWDNEIKDLVIKDLKSKRNG